MRCIAVTVVYPSGERSPAWSMEGTDEIVWLESEDRDLWDRSFRNNLWVDYPC